MDRQDSYACPHERTWEKESWKIKAQAESQAANQSARRDQGQRLAAQGGRPIYESVSEWPAIRPQIKTIVEQDTEFSKRRGIVWSQRSKPGAKRKRRIAKTKAEQLI